MDNFNDLNDILSDEEIAEVCELIFESTEYESELKNKEKGKEYAEQK